MENYTYEIIQFGLFDSAAKFPDTAVTRDRLLDCFEIELYTSDCPGLAYIDGTSHALNSGLLVCCKPGQTRHSRLPFKCCYLHIKTPSKALEKRLLQLKDTDYPSEFEELTKLFYKIAAHDGAEISDYFFVRSCTDRILYLLLKSGEKPPQSKRGAHAKELGEIKDYIKYRYFENLSLESLSRRVGLSPVYFHKLFCENFGITPAKYVANTRITAAKQLLISSDKTVAEIAEECGFSSQSYFNSIFKASTGMSPLKYKKETLSRMQI